MGSNGLTASKFISEALKSLVVRAQERMEKNQ
jgi:hypothetical protein